MEKLANAMAIIATINDDEFAEIRNFQGGDGDLRRLFRKKSLFFSDCLKSHKHIDLGTKGGASYSKKAKLTRELFAILERLRNEKKMLQTERDELVGKVNNLIDKLSRSEVEIKELEDMIKVLKERLRQKRRKKGGDDGGEEK